MLPDSKVMTSESHGVSEPHGSSELRERPRLSTRGRAYVYATDEERAAARREQTLRSRCRERELRRVLRESGNLEVVKRGRPPIYETDEARKAALKEQMAACHRRYAARVKEARERLAHSNDDTLLKYSAVIND
jgi:hypothetical protein